MKNTSQEPVTRVYIESISVPFSYPVYFTRNAFSASNPILAETIGRPVVGGVSPRCGNSRGGDVPPTRDHPDARATKALVYFDAGLVAAQPHLPRAAVEYAKKHCEAMEFLAPPRVLPGGEGAKDGWAVAQPVLDEIIAHRLDRHSYVLAVGGGAFLDAVGFAASLVHRGVRLVRLPSTTLSQDDGGVGVKTGVNLGGVKNLLGTFAPPFAVINDLEFLRTLPRDVMLDGIAEAFKVAIIKDAAFFGFLCDAGDRLAAGEQEAVEQAVRRAAVLHLEHIRDGADPFEMGDARPLDFGHWAAHRLEGLSGYAVRHGQGVAVGIALDSVYASLNSLLSREELDRILAALRRCGLPAWHPLLGERDAAGRLAILEGIEQFREHLGGRLSITLPSGIGRRVEVHEMDSALIGEAIAFLREAQ
ncbi:MAG TPA: 3-dehydroquinate synthase [Planctomycetota bacterium]|nr:3-dehydroquinate synthase [Planctomycetota bacterium]HRR79546.1 3-dehydroquinate synthase [Planctomycetota bacterium]HRT96062.1 3-dehydroquinate synthase [Planctomycetota bacterium]